MNSVNIHFNSLLRGFDPFNRQKTIEHTSQVGDRYVMLPPRMMPLDMTMGSQAFEGLQV